MEKTACTALETVLLYLTSFSLGRKLDNLISKRITNSAVICSPSFNLSKLVINIWETLGLPHSEKKKVWTLWYSLMQARKTSEAFNTSLGFFHLHGAYSFCRILCLFMETCNTRPKYWQCPLDTIYCLFHGLNTVTSRSSLLRKHWKLASKRLNFDPWY